MGSTTIVLHAPQEREIDSVKEVWDLATEPGLLLFLYCLWDRNMDLFAIYFPFFLCYIHSY